LSGSTLFAPKEDIGSGDVRGGGSDATASACAPEARAPSAALTVGLPQCGQKPRASATSPPQFSQRIMSA
jgi:hypothetical protein